MHGVKVMRVRRISSRARHILGGLTNSPTGGHFTAQAEHAKAYNDYEDVQELMDALCISAESARRILTCHNPITRTPDA
jgi:hypothetical protein